MCISTLLYLGRLQTLLVEDLHRTGWTDNTYRRDQPQPTTLAPPWDGPSDIKTIPMPVRDTRTQAHVPSVFGANFPASYSPSPTTAVLNCHWPGAWPAMVRSERPNIGRSYIPMKIETAEGAATQGTEGGRVVRGLINSIPLAATRLREHVERFVDGSGGSRAEGQCLVQVLQVRAVSYWHVSTNVTLYFSICVPLFMNRTADCAGYICLCPTDVWCYWKGSPSGYRDIVFLLFF